MNYLVCKQWLDDSNAQQRKKLVHESKFYWWDETYLYSLDSNHILHRCVLEYKTQQILESYMSSHTEDFSGQRTTTKVLQSWYFWQTLFKDARVDAVA